MAYIEKVHAIHSSMGPLVTYLGETEVAMYKVWFVNFGYYSSNESEDLEGAKKTARKAGFQSVIYDNDGVPRASYCPISGMRDLRDRVEMG